MIEIGTESTPIRLTRWTFPAKIINGRRYTLDGKQALYENFYQLYTNHDSELSLEEQVYNKYGGDEGPRRSGRTTRIIEQAIQEMIEDGQTLVGDHHPTEMMQDYAWDIFVRRMMREHPHIEFEIEQGGKGHPRKIFRIN